MIARVMFYSTLKADISCKLVLQANFELRKVSTAMLEIVDTNAKFMLKN